jgi:pilus assembly protein CpaF
MSSSGNPEAWYRMRQRIESVAARGAAGKSEGRLPIQPGPPPEAQAANDPQSQVADLDAVRASTLALTRSQIDATLAARQPRGELAHACERIVLTFLNTRRLFLTPQQLRELVDSLVEERIAAGQAVSPPQSPLEPAAAPPAPVANLSARAKIENAAPRIYPLVMERINSEVATTLSPAELQQQLSAIVQEILIELKLQFNQREQGDLVTLLLNDMTGLGPLEPLLADDTITDIMVNGAKKIYVERRGKLTLTDASFRDNAHVMSIATRIVSGVGRRVDESTPLVDARLADGSRVNIIIPPLAIDGPAISIRKFSKKSITLDVMARQQNLSPAMATVLKIASRSQLNILISGGTGSGKTTLLNALSQMIDPDERIVTIEDAAELQLQQPHVVRLETRPASLEGRGEMSMRDLVKNALRMRPDRIILGEIRGAEAIDMLQAMNTGHDGSLGTIHANRPREALTRMENMVGMSGVNLPSRAVRAQIAAAVQMILQISRMRDGVRRVTSITEIVGMEGEVITTQELFSYKFEGTGPDGLLRGRFESSGLRPHFTPRAEYHGLDRLLLEAIG